MNKIIILPLLCLMSLNTMAADVNSAALAVKTANKICQSPLQRGNNNKIQLHGNIKANLGKVLKKLAQLNGTGDASYVAEEWIGINQNQLAKAMESSNSCKLEVFKLMMQSSKQKGWKDDKYIKNTKIKSKPFLQHTNGGASPLLVKPKPLAINVAKVNGCNSVESKARVQLLDETSTQYVTFVKVKVLEGTCKGLIGWTNKDFYHLR